MSEISLVISLSRSQVPKFQLGNAYPQARAWKPDIRQSNKVRVQKLLKQFTKGVWFLGKIIQLSVSNIRTCMIYK